MEQLKGFLLAEPIKDQGRLQEKCFCLDVLFEWMSCLMSSRPVRFDVVDAPFRIDIVAIVVATRDDCSVRGVIAKTERE